MIVDIARSIHPAPAIVATRPTDRHRRTQTPFSAVWKVTHSTRPAKASSVGDAVGQQFKAR
jgi:hypothetical protein